MAEPATGGQLRTSIADMQIGDYIVCKFMIPGANQAGTFSNLGATNGSEIPYTGIGTIYNATRNFYFIKVDGQPGQGSLLVADRIVQESVSWDILNTADYIQGKPVTLGGITGIIRSLGGGNSYATVDGKSSTTDTGNGAWPTDNEYNKYIVGMFGGADDVWHWSNIYTWCQETPIEGFTGATGRQAQRIARGYTSASRIQITQSSMTGAAYGFRPVFEYQEVTP